VLEALASTPQGLSAEEADRRVQEVGPNALLSHGARRADERRAAAV
jgi:Cation transporter/ATPase, N-terminus